MSADIRLNSHNVCVSNIHDISLKGLQVLHLQDIFVRLTIDIPHFQGNHFLSCPKTLQGQGREKSTSKCPTIWGSISPTLSESRFNPAQLQSWPRERAGPMDPFKSSQEVQGLKDFGRKTPGPTIAATFILDDPKILRRAESGSNCWTKGHVWWIFEWFLVNVGNSSTENPRSQGFWRKLKHSPVQTWIWTSWWHHVYLLKRAWWTTLRFCWSIFRLNDAGKLLS